MLKIWEYFKFKKLPEKHEAGAGESVRQDQRVCWPHVHVLCSGGDDWSRFALFFFWWFCDVEIWNIWCTSQGAEVTVFCLYYCRVLCFYLHGFVFHCRVLLLTGFSATPCCLTWLLDSLETRSILLQALAATSWRSENGTRDQWRCSRVGTNHLALVGGLEGWRNWRIPDGFVPSVERQMPCLNSGSASYEGLSLCGLWRPSPLERPC